MVAWWQPPSVFATVAWLAHEGMRAGKSRGIEAALLSTLIFFGALSISENAANMPVRPTALALAGIRTSALQRPSLLLTRRLSSASWWNTEKRSIATAPALPRYTMDGVQNDYGGVLTTLSHYFNALHMNDSAEMRRVWNTECHLKRPSGDGGVVDIDAEAFFKIVDRKDGSDSSAALSSDAVHSIQFSASNMALAKVQIALGDAVYTDFLALLKLSSGWSIVAKLFASRAAHLAYIVDTTPLDTSHSELGRVAAEYVSARRAADAPRLAAVLHPCYQMFTVNSDGELMSLSRDFFLADLATFGGPRWETAALVPRRFDRVVSIDKSGPDTAVIKLHVGSTDVTGEPRLLTDFLMCVRVGGGWRVVSRVYTPRWLGPAD